MKKSCQARFSQRIKVSIFTFALIFLSSKNSFAANYFQTNSSLANVTGQAGQYDYNKTVLSNTIEYNNLPNQMSVGTNFQLSYVDSEYKNGTNQFAFNFIELWHRWRFYTDDKFRISLQNLYKFPGSYEVNKNIGLGARQQDYEVRILTDYNMKEGLTNSLVHRSTNFLLRFEIAYRRRFENPFDEARMNVVLARNINAKFTLMAQQSVIWNIYSSQQNSNTNNSVSSFNANNDANNMLTFSTLYHLNDKAALQFGYTHKWHGNSTTHDKYGFLVGVLAAF